MIDAYGIFAKHYDTFTQNIDYKKRAEYFQSVIQKHVPHLQGNILLDLGCGTGSLSEAFSVLGYDVIGVDSSIEMLNVAIQKREHNGSKTLYLNQDITNLDMYGTVDIAVCALDTVNHLPDMEALQKLFQGVSLFLHPEGIFLFDCNTLFKHKNVLADNVFVYESDWAYLVWKNQFVAENATVDITLDIFERQKNGAYTKEQENFSERIFTEDDIKSALEEANLDLVEIYNEDSFEKPDSDTQRLIYVVKKANTNQ